MTATPRILVAEDNPALQTVVKFNLKRKGFEVSTASDGNEACKSIAQTKFDAIITDYQMPGKVGTEVAQFARQLPGYENIPIILLTAKAFELSEEECRQQHGISAILCKPFSPIQLVAFTQELMAEHQVSN